MKRTLRNINLLLGLLAALGLLAGCRGQEAEPKKTETALSPTTAAPGAVGGRGGHAGIPDIEPYAAPPGVKTGIEGGRK